MYNLADEGVQFSPTQLFSQSRRGCSASNGQGVQLGRYIQQEQSKAVLDGFFAWLQNVNASGGTKLSKAVHYALNEKKYLYAFLEDSSVPIDNNRAENAIRPFVVGRKNWLFSDSVKGAKASAMLYSLAATAAANGLNVEKYFSELFRSPGFLLPWLV